jgi:1-acyl-sn-glycerol-3-phosphate acyltransferase
MSSPSAFDAEFRATPPVVRLPLLYRLFREPVRRLLERCFALSVEGSEHLPMRGPYIVAANHHNYLDGIVLAVAVPHPISFLVMPRVWRATPLHPLLHRHIGSIPLQVTRPDVGALRHALCALDDGRVVGIFPEGPFSVRGRLEVGLHGVALLALRSGVPVVPAGIHGTYQALLGRRFYIPRRHPLRVRFGAPRRFSGDSVISADEGPITRRAGAVVERRRLARAAVTDRIMADIATLLR